MNKKGFTIVELMVTMVIMSIIIGIVYSSFNTMVSDVKTETKSIESIMDTMVGLEIIRLDIEHAGFGLATNEPCGYPVRGITADGNPSGCSPGSNQDNVPSSPRNLALVLRSTINASNQSTYGWYQCKDGNATRVYDGRGDTSNNHAVLLKFDKTYKSHGSYANCPGDEDVLGYPYITVGGSPANGCQTQFCNRITYRLSTNSLPNCHPNTRNLLRAVGNDAGDPILNCVANWSVRFSLDTDGDGTIDQHFATTPYAGTETGANIRSQLKAVHVYILLQDSQFDPDYNADYNSTTTRLTIDGVDLKTLGSTNITSWANFNNYRWKMLKITAKPMNL